MNRIGHENVGQHLVLSATVNHVSGSSFYQVAHVGPRELENLSENVNILRIVNRWRGEMVQLRGITLSDENGNKDYLTALIFVENTIIQL